MNLKLSSPTLYLALAVAAIAILASLWWYFTSSPAPVDTWIEAKEAKQVKSVPKIEIALPKVKVYAPAAKQKLDLPTRIKADKAEHVITATRIEKDLRPQTITTLVNEQTGEVQTIVRREPLPWLAAEQTGELRFDVGYKDMRRIVRLSLREDLLQVKAFHAGLNFTLDSDGKYFYGAGIGWKW